MSRELSPARETYNDNTLLGREATQTARFEELKQGLRHARRCEKPAHVVRLGHVAGGQ